MHTTDYLAKWRGKEDDTWFAPNMNNLLSPPNKLTILYERVMLQHISQHIIVYKKINYAMQTKHLDFR